MHYHIKIITHSISIAPLGFVLISLCVYHVGLASYHESQENVPFYLKTTVLKSMVCVCVCLCRYLMYGRLLIFEVYTVIHVIYNYTFQIKKRLVTSLDTVLLLCIISQLS